MMWIICIYILPLAILANTCNEVDLPTITVCFSLQLVHKEIVSLCVDLNYIHKDLSFPHQTGKEKVILWLSNHQMIGVVKK